MSSRRLVLILCVLALGNGCASTYPRVVLSNDAVKAVVYTPDNQKGFYRAVRFDRSGMIAGVEWKDHTFFGEWKDRAHNPYYSDDVVGPAEEFGMTHPLGFAEAEVGETFLKIGVGRLRKPDPKPYWFPRTYELVDFGKWTVTHGKDWVEFIHEVEDPQGYAYHYRKRMELSEEPPGFVISRVLTNTGTKPIVTSWYNHNFVVIDGQPVGPDLKIRLPFEIKNPQVVQDVVDVRPEGIGFLGPYRPDVGYGASIEGDLTTLRHAPMTFVNTRSGAGLKVGFDFTPVKLNFYGIGKAICLEPFLEIHLDPGESFAWQNPYHFFSLSQAERDFDPSKESDASENTINYEIDHP
ncbi:MAG: hypothetical protein WD708_05470 [Kiritimatiellia bacterium]